MQCVTNSVKNMKKVIVNFEQMKGQSPELNSALVEITEPENATENALVWSIAFKKPVKAISHQQLGDLLYSIDQQVQDIETGSGIGLPHEMAMPGIPMVSSGNGILGFRDRLEKGFAKIDGSLTPEDRQLKDGALALIDKLMGRKK